MNRSNLARPQLQLLSPDQIQRIHQSSLDILSTTGFRVDSVDARRIFEKSGDARVDDSHVYLQNDLVEWALENAPAEIDVYQRDGEHAFRLGGGGPARFGVGVTNLYYQDPATGQPLPFTRERLASAVRLGDALDQFDIISTIGVLQDKPANSADLYATLELVANTSKPLVLLIAEEKLFSPALDLLEHLNGDLVTHPFVIPYFNPLTPLIINQGTCDKLLETVKRGLPLIYSNYGMSGMSTPITAAGTLALMNAELLAGLTLCQLAKPGTPVILGSLPAIFDMKNMSDYYGPQTILLNLACSEMMANYAIPHAGTSGSSLGWRADLPASGLLWLNHLTSLTGNAGLAPFVGGVLGSKVFSPENVVYSNDVIAEARRFAAGLQLDMESLAVDEIAKVGPGGDFLTTDLTMRNFRAAYQESPIFPRLTLEQWQAHDQPQASLLLRDYTLRLLSEADRPVDHANLIAKGEDFIDRSART